MWSTGRRRRARRAAAAHQTVPSLGDFDSRKPGFGRYDDWILHHPKTENMGGVQQPPTPVPFPMKLSRILPQANARYGRPYGLPALVLLE